MRYIKIKMDENLFEAAKAFALVTGSTVDGIATRLIRQHISQFAPALLADEYQQSAIDSANSTMPDDNSEESDWYEELNRGYAQDRI